MSTSRTENLDQHPNRPTHFGSGWISGTFGVALGAIGLGAVLCFHFPSVLTMPELRRLYPLPYVGLFCI